MSLVLRTNETGLRTSEKYRHDRMFRLVKGTLSFKYEDNRVTLIVK